VRRPKLLPLFPILLKHLYDADGVVEEARRLLDDVDAFKSDIGVTTALACRAAEGVVRHIDGDDSFRARR